VLGQGQVPDKGEHPIAWTRGREPPGVANQKDGMGASMIYSLTRVAEAPGGMARQGWPILGVIPSVGWDRHRGGTVRGRVLRVRWTWHRVVHPIREVPTVGGPARRRPTHLGYPTGGQGGLTEGGQGGQLRYPAGWTKVTDGVDEGGRGGGSGSPPEGGKQGWSRGGLARRIGMSIQSGRRDGSRHPP
jgi:hypothetical protein